MPLSTQIIRNGKPLVLPWGEFHIAAMALAASFDSGKGPLANPDEIYDDVKYSETPEKPFTITPNLSWILASYSMLAQTPLNNGTYTLTKRHIFKDTRDGEILELLPGDELHAWR